MTVLILNDEVRARIKALVEFTARPANYYTPGPKAKPPGDDPRYVVQLGSYRCVFSLTRMPDKHLYRHLSVSVKKRGKYPLPEGVEMIGKELGFEGVFESWSMKIVDHAVVVIQRVYSQLH